MLLDPENFTRTTYEKLFLNVLCCLIVYFVVQIFTNNSGLTCIIAHVSLLSFGFVDYFVYLFRGNEFTFSDIRSIGTGLSVAGNYKLQLNDRGVYVIFLAALFIAFVRKLACPVYRKNSDAGNFCDGDCLKLCDHCSKCL